MKNVDVAAAVLVVVGAVNWGLVGAAHMDLVALLFGAGSILSRSSTSSSAWPGCIRPCSGRRSRVVGELMCGWPDSDSESDLGSSPNDSEGAFRLCAVVKGSDFDAPANPGGTFSSMLGPGRQRALLDELAGCKRTLAAVLAPEGELTASPIRRRQSGSAAGCSARTAASRRRSADRGGVRGTALRASGSAVRSVSGSWLTSPRVSSMAGRYALNWWESASHVSECFDPDRGPRHSIISVVLRLNWPRLAREQAMVGGVSV